MNYITDIFKCITRGLVDSIKGSFVLFYLDKNFKEKAALKLAHRSNNSSKQSNYGGSKTFKNNEDKEPISRHLITPLSKSDTSFNRFFKLFLQSSSCQTANHQHSTQILEPKILKRTLQCCALNGGVFWASLLIFDVVLLPLLKALVGLAMGNASSSGQVWFWIKTFLSWTFSAVWVVPLLLLSKVVNNLWFMDIADLAYKYTRGNVYVPRSVSFAVADTFFSVLVQILFLIQSVFVCLLPSPFGQLIWLVHMCMLYSLYSFEYRWVNMGWELHRRLTYIEYHWPYFIGFGLPLALLTSLPSSYIVSGCVFSIFFPLFIVSGNEANLNNEVPNYYPLQFFRPVVFISNSILTNWRKRSHS